MDKKQHEKNMDDFDFNMGVLFMAMIPIFLLTCLVLHIIMKFV